MLLQLLDRVMGRSRGERHIGQRGVLVGGGSHARGLSRFAPECDTSRRESIRGMACNSLDT